MRRYDYVNSILCRWFTINLNSASERITIKLKEVMEMACGKSHKGACGTKKKTAKKKTAKKK